MTSTESVGATAWGKTRAPLYVSFNDQMLMYLGESLPLDPLLAKRLLSDIAPGCAQNATITNVSARGDATPVVSADWPGGNIPFRNDACLIQADLRTEHGALVFSHDGEIGLVCVSVEYIRSVSQWHADLVFMVAR